MPGAPAIRPYRPADHEQLMRFLERVLTDLGFEFLPDGKDLDVRDLEDVYLRDRGSFHVVEADGRISGSVGVRPLAADAAELKRLYLAPELRGRGIGRSLCTAAIEDARRLGYRRLRLDTTRRSPAAIALFRTLGFQEIPRYNSNPDAEIFMEYAL
jgi:putative acetyltransferase